jgi:hypothetical protein
MEGLFADYWWLMFPMAWFALALINAIKGEPNASRTICVSAEDARSGVPVRRAGPRQRARGAP